MTAAVETALLALDIGARKHAYAGQYKGTAGSGSVDADPAAVRALIGRWLKHCGRLHVLVEATGIYYLDVALIASDLGATVSVINPKTAHNFAKALGLRNKTDAVDAAMLLQFLKRMPLTAWERPGQGVLELRYYGRYLTQLTEDKTAAGNRLHALAATGSSPAALRADLKRAIASLDKRIHRLRDQVIALLQADPALKARFDALVSVKGIAQTAAVSLLAELMLLPRDMSARACVSHAGLDPRQHESGTSVRKAPRISRQGNKHLRRALFHPAMAASSHDPGAQAFKARLLAAGKKPMQAIVAIMRKLLTLAWAMVRNPQPYDSAKLFHMPERA